MFKIIAYLTLALVGIFSIAFLTSYIPYVAESFSLPDISLDLDHLVPKNATRRLQYLDKLVEMPLVGRFFLEEKIRELISINEFSESLQWSRRAVSDPFTSKSFAVWYHKALAQCILMQYGQCESSLAWATYYATHQLEPYVQSVYRFLEMHSEVKKHKVQAKGHQIILQAQPSEKSELEQL